MIRDLAVSLVILIVFTIPYALVGASNGLPIKSDFFSDLIKYPIVLYFYLFFLLLGTGLLFLIKNSHSNNFVLFSLIFSFYFYLIFNCFGLGYTESTSAFNYVSSADLQRQTQWLIGSDDVVKRIKATVLSSIFTLLTIIYPLLALVGGFVFQYLVKK